jgi:ABC-type lipoprotein release transport system permease subunit
MGSATAVEYEIGAVLESQIRGFARAYFYGMYWMLKRDFVNTQVMTYYRYFFRPRKNQFKKLTFMCRVYAIVVTAALGKIMIGYAPNYEKNVLKSFVSWHVYTFEMYEQGRCRNTGFNKQLQLTKSTALFSKKNVKGFEYVILNCEA